MGARGTRGAVLASGCGVVDVDPLRGIGCATTPLPATGLPTTHLAQLLVWGAVATRVSTPRDGHRALEIGVARGARCPSDAGTGAAVEDPWSAHSGGRPLSGAQRACLPPAGP